MKKFISSILIATFLIQTNAAFAQNTDAFNLAGIIENIINYQSKNEFVSDIRDDSQGKFDFASKNYRNGNIVVAYSEYLNTIDSLDKNIALLSLSKELYEIGFFTLGDISLSKISGRNRMNFQIEKLKETYKPSYNLTKDEETYLAKILVSAFYNKSPEEAAFNLIKKNVLLENSDYANFVMAQSMFECKQYNQALIYVNKAIDKNSANSNYKLFKAKTLYKMKKYKEALKYIEEIENNFSIYLSLNLDILKQQIKEQTSVDDLDKKFHQIYVYYLTGNYYKTIKETKNILNFYKNNYKILTLQAMAHIALGEIETAREELNLSLKLNKKFNLTLMGLADINFIDKNYKNSYAMYKKLFNTEYNKEAVLKAELSLINLSGDSKKLDKIAKIKGNMEETSSFEFYRIANNLYFNDEKNNKKFIAKSLGINFLNPLSWNSLCEFDVRDNNFENLDRNLFIFSFSDEKTAQYYYYLALSLNNKNQKKEAFFEIKKAINLDPDFKPAINLLNKLEEELI